MQTALSHENITCPVCSQSGFTNVNIMTHAELCLLRKNKGGREKPPTNRQKRAEGKENIAVGSSTGRPKPEISRRNIGQNLPKAKDKQFIGEQICPICGISGFEAKNFQEHLNACINGDSVVESRKVSRCNSQQESEDRSITDVLRSSRSFTDPFELCMSSIGPAQTQSIHSPSYLEVTLNIVTFLRI